MSRLAQPASGPSVLSLRILGWIAGAVAALFSLLAIEHALALAGGRVELAARLRDAGLVTIVTNEHELAEALASTDTAEAAPPVRASGRLISELREFITDHVR